jgi:hypothetical protein
MIKLGMILIFSKMHRLFRLKTGNFEFLICAANKIEDEVDSVISLYQRQRFESCSFNVLDRKPVKLSTYMNRSIFGFLVQEPATVNAT